jgi:GNAT superfamily N-acetyltransferase
MTVQIVEVGPDDPRLAPLIGELRVELDARYPEEVDFDHPVVKREAYFLLAIRSGVPVACCAVQPLDGDECELKRMYVVPDVRGQGIAGRLMTRVEELAARLGAVRVKLETGQRQPEAIKVYERAGYAQIPNYPPYDGWDLSVCYAKALVPSVPSTP